MVAATRPQLIATVPSLGSSEVEIHLPMLSEPTSGEPTTPAPTEPTASTTSGASMMASDSRGCPWPR